MIKLKLHSVVDVITNSSTVIYTYQDSCVAPAKDLINEMLKTSNITDKTADDLFYFGSFHDDKHYLRILDDLEPVPEGCPVITGNYGTPEYESSNEKRDKWLNDLIENIVKGIVEMPKWMLSREENYNGYRYNTYIYLLPKEEKYKEFGNKISTLLNSVRNDGGYDG